MGGVLYICYEMVIFLSVVDDKINKVERNMVFEFGEDVRCIDLNVEKFVVVIKFIEY